MSLPEVHLIGGTRAEAVVAALRAGGLVSPVLIAGGPAEPLTEMIKRLDARWTTRPPAAVIVPDDSTPSLAGALAAYWHRIPVVHLEAGLRSDDLDSPVRDEANRRLVAQLAALHLAPTPVAAMNLLDEDVGAENVLITDDTAPLAIAGWLLATGRIN